MDNVDVDQVKAERSRAPGGETVLVLNIAMSESDALKVGTVLILF